jgi:hypothetical protein
MKNPRASIARNGASFAKATTEPSMYAHAVTER